VLKHLLDRVTESLDAIMPLEPKPGHRFGANDSRYIARDVFVYKMRGEYTTPYGKGRLPIASPLRENMPLAGVRFPGVSALIHTPLLRGCPKTNV
jgi:hypothetical protein